jgi:hypothetical protein
MFITKNDRFDKQTAWVIADDICAFKRLLQKMTDLTEVKFTPLVRKLLLVHKCSV